MEKIIELITKFLSDLKGGRFENIDPKDMIWKIELKENQIKIIDIYTYDNHFICGFRQNEETEEVDLWCMDRDDINLRTIDRIAICDSVILPALKEYNREHRGKIYGKEN